jgi:hypothetical protein
LCAAIDRDKTRKQQSNPKSRQTKSRIDWDGKREWCIRTACRYDTCGTNWPQLEKRWKEKR